jgi:hypothetical protein
MLLGGNLRRFVIVLWVAGSLCAPPAVPAAEGYTLVLKDGRRIEIDGYEASGGWLFYQRFGARVGVARHKIREIIPNSPGDAVVPLEDEIVGRVYRTHKLRFTLDDFRQADYRAAEIDPLLAAPEQAAYIRKLLRILAIEIFAIDDLHQAAETTGDVVELGVQEEKLIAALTTWDRGQQALTLVAPQGEAAEAPDPIALDASAAPGVSGPDPIEADVGEAPASPGEEASESLPPAVSVEDARAAMSDLEKLQHERERLRLMVKKHYRAPDKAGGFLALRAAERYLRIIDLQIRYFDRLPPGATAFSAPAHPIY